MILFVFLNACQDVSLSKCLQDEVTYSILGGPNADHFDLRYLSGDFYIIRSLMGFTETLYDVSDYSIFHKWAASWQNQQNDMAPSKDSDQPGNPASLICLCCPHEESLGPYWPIKHTTKTLIRQGGCPGWSESSVVAHATLLVLLLGGSNIFVF